MLVGILASFAAFEADLISARTRAALAVVQKNGSRSGRRIGNPAFVQIPDAVAARIRALRSSGFSFRQIAEQLNAQSVPTMQGGRRWHPQTVANVCKREPE